MSAYNGTDFSVGRNVSVEKKSEYVLHNHKNVCEILFFLKGNSSFVVEGTVYPLCPEDFVIARHDEMHRVVHHASGTYERVVINFDNDFFENHDCNEYAPSFFDRPAGSGNLFSAGKSQQAVEALHRLITYAEEGAPEVLVRGVLCEVLRCISKEGSAASGSVTSPRLREIILFINDNLSAPLTLENLSRDFYISKYHLCRLFKNQTGMTVGQYITKKRLLRVGELHAGGMSLTDAALSAGFNDYSSYWHARGRQSAESTEKKS